MAEQNKKRNKDQRRQGAKKTYDKLDPELAEESVFMVDKKKK